MSNYQLYRTNVLLGGQMKYDLVLGYGGEDLIVTDFHITPISNNVPFNKHIDENLLNYKHLGDNIKSFYKSIKSSFYQEYPNPDLISDNLLIVDNDKNPSTYDNTYEMGCRRMQYQLYGKQFNFLCPVWIEHLDENESLMFQIELGFNKGGDGYKSFIRKNLILKECPNYTYHNKFSNYINEYFKEINIKSNHQTSNKLIFIGEEHGKIISRIHGINVEYGGIQDKEIILFDNLIDREKPLLENDYLIIRSFADNKLISKQLHNFNLCFNLEDFVGVNFSNMLIGKDIYVNVRVGVVSNEEVNMLQLVDFYSNYTFIPKVCVNPRKVGKINIDIYNQSRNKLDFIQPTNKPNVLDYLKDYDYVNHINKNKIIQSVFHWSLDENNDYIFNLYPGFEGYYEYIVDDNKKIYNINYKYNDTPNYLEAEYKEKYNTIGWCNCIDIRKAENINDLDIYDWYETLPLFIKKYGNQIYDDKYSHIWVKNVRYKIPELNKYSSAYILAIYQNKLLITDKFGWKWEKIEYDGCGCYIGYKQSNDELYYCIICDNLKAISYKSFFNHIKEIKNNDELNYLYSLFTNYSKNSKIIQCSRTLDIIRNDSPSLSSIEINYLKDDIHKGKPMERYFGDIKPTFTNADQSDNSNLIMENVLYKKITTTRIDYKNSDFYKYKSTGYLPTYKSIGYNLYDEIPLTYNEIPSIYDENINKNLYEYNWYEDNKHIYLNPIMNFDLSMSYDKEKGYPKLVDLIKEKLEEYYNIDREKSEYIFSKYTYESDFEYDIFDLNEGRHSYKYNVRMKLK